MNNNNINDDKRNNDNNNNSNNNINANSNAVDDFDGADSYYVRDPDPIKKEQLIGYGAFEQKPLSYQNFNDQNFDDQFKKAIEISKKDFDIFQDEEDKKNIELIEKEKEKERISQFQPIRQKLQRILAIDKVNTLLYENIFNIITLYELGYITKYNTSEEEVSAFFKLFNSIRLTNEELCSLKQIIGNE